MALNNEIPAQPEGPNDQDLTEGEELQAQRTWARRYPPLISLIAAMLIAVIVLPSSLNLPQTNPTQTLEYAPVPPEDSDNPPPAQGNLSSLGLAGSSGLEGDGAAGGGGAGALPPKLPPGVGKDPSKFRCVGNPPRQTEDPLAPPCVAFFDGDNFDETYQGVTKDEIRIVLYKDGGIGTVGTSRGQETCPQTEMIDLVNDPPKQDECHEIRMARLWQRYFNDRYQTYNRYVHFFIYFGTNVNSTSPETRRADAAEVYRQVQPFATLDFSSFEGGGDSFVDSLAKRGVLNFGSFVGQEAKFFTRYPKLVWGFAPSLEIQADTYAGVLCQKYVPFPVDHSDQYAGKQRKFGLVYTTDNGYQTLRNFKDQVMARFNQCGGSLATDPQTFPKAGYSLDTETSNRYALTAMQKFQAAGVTTVIWPGGLETNYTKAAKQLNYYPEWIVAGDGFTDNQFAQQGYRNSHGQDPDVWDFAVVVTPEVQIPTPETNRICFQALRSVDPNVPVQDGVRTGCDMYDNLRQLFIGIQVAGPRLGPSSIDRGFHAIPAIPSQNLQVPSCYYLTGDYTCVKDYVIGRWDNDGDVEKNPDSPGCYKIVGNRRQPPGTPSRARPMAEYKASDPCLGFGSGLQQNIAPPDPNEL
jgi:hypothetical protein